jgi:formylglycine-generating enzyme required for sulfatase activity
MKVSLTFLAIVFAGVVVGSGCGPSRYGPVDGMEFVTIPAGSFQMGSPSAESGRWENEKQHLVTVSSFELMTTEVTQGMWEEVMGTTVDEMRRRSEYDFGLAGVGEDLPIYYVSWNDCQEFMERLNAMDSSYTYRLPTEAEWEYAARAGTTTRYYWGDDPDEDQIGNHAWFTGNSDGSTHPVGSKMPNAWGLYDMSGNVWEWCEDVFASYYDNCPTDGSAYAGPGSNRVLRGGSWSDNASFCRSATRFYDGPGYRLGYMGFRVARSVR